jgi:hypothetical protein
MEFEEFENTKIFETLKDEFYRANPYVNWRDFIDAKDLGVVVSHKNNQLYYVYIVLDEKKWLINKIKYGF